LSMYPGTSELVSAKAPLAPYAISTTSEIFALQMNLTGSLFYKGLGYSFWVTQRSPHPTQIPLSKFMLTLLMQ